MKQLFWTGLMALVIICGIACDKESPLDANRRRYPIPTELPALTCEGANTVGAYVDSILFVANYYPNFSLWGGNPPPGGISAHFENFEPELNYIRVFATHARRPDTLDDRHMHLELKYYAEIDSIGSVTFRYKGPNLETNVWSKNIIQNSRPNLIFDTIDSTLCGSISEYRLVESTEEFGDPDIKDTITLRDYRIDVKVRPTRY